LRRLSSVDGPQVQFAAKEVHIQYDDCVLGDSYYNYFRDYDPAIGRYTQSDPIGLASGLNTFAYVGSNPLLLIDEFGLAQCTYSISRHSLTCDPSMRGNNGGTVTPGPDGLFSGIGTCQNNPSNQCQNQKKGPVPEGDYDMLPYDGQHANSDDWWRLRPQSILRRAIDGSGFGRGGGYLLHPGRDSWGCITYGKGDDAFGHLNNLLRREKGNNTLRVTH
jgi:RHS repeat-associated protein